MALHDLMQRRADLAREARKLVETADKEGRSLTEGERNRFQAIEEEVRGKDGKGGLDAEIETRQKISAFSDAVTEGRSSDPLPHDPSQTKHRYSLLKAIRQVADRMTGNGGGLDGLELEVSQELIKRRGSPLKRGASFCMPTDLPINMGVAARFAQQWGRNLDGTQKRTFDTTAGAGAIPTILDTNYIELLRNRMVVDEAGATLLSEMQGLFAIPRRTAASTLYWVAEGASITGSNTTVDQVPFTPRTAGAMTDISRRLTEQINTDSETFVRRDLSAVVARGVDLAALNGTGQNNQPLGVAQNPNVGIVALGTNGGPPTWDMVVNLETNVATANADLGRLSYITNAKGRGILKRTAKIGSTFPIYLWDTQNPDTPLNGYPCHVTNQLPSNLSKGTSGAVCSPVLYGNWEDLVIAMWSGQDVIVDPFTGSASGTLRLVMLQDIDINLRHPESFQKCVDMTT